MAKKDKDKIKELGDQKLVAEIEKLQNQISLEQNQTIIMFRIKF